MAIRPETCWSANQEDSQTETNAIIEFRPRLVVIDPIQAYLSSDTDLQIAGRARRLMHHLGMWATAYDCAIVLIGHLNKKEGAKGLYRSLGSIDVVAASRSVLQVERNPENPCIRLVRQIKNSLGPDGAEIGFFITEEDGFQWLDSSDKQSDEAQKYSADFKTKAEKASFLIKKLLAEGDMPSKGIHETLKKAGISRRTIEETKKVLGIQSYRKMRKWYWTIDRKP